MSRSRSAPCPEESGDRGYLSLMPEDRDQVEVDARFALANERTLLAWTRTSLALLASGGALQQLSDLPARQPLAMLLVAVGIAAAVAGGIRYTRTATALRRAAPAVQGSAAPVALAALVALAGTLLVIVLIAA